MDYPIFVLTFSLSLLRVLKYLWWCSYFFISFLRDYATWLNLYSFNLLSYFDCSQSYFKFASSSLFFSLRLFTLATFYWQSYFSKAIAYLWMLSVRTMCTISRLILVLNWRSWSTSFSKTLFVSNCSS